MRVFLTLCFSLCLATRSEAAFDSGSTGVDGAFHPTSNVTIDLSQADSGPGTGTYDSGRWAVIFNYTSITIPAGVTVRFTNHPSGAPVVWLASGDVSIAGSVILDGSTGSNYSYGPPGPGGFAGGRGGTDPNHSPAAWGLGPGGGASSSGWGGGGAGSYGTGSRPYGNIAIMPLIGGSGGGGSITPASNSGGGGAILIAASGDIVVNGLVRSDGSAGGAIKLLGTSVSGLGQLRAVGQVQNALGRIRIEAENIEMPDRGYPPWTFTLSPGAVFPDAQAPTLTGTLVDGQPIPSDPVAGITTTDVTISSAGSVTLNIVATNIPVGTTVTVFVVPDGGAAYSVTSSPLSGSLSLSTATASVSFPTLKKSEVYLKANW